MTTYSAVLFIHVVGAIVLVGGSLFAPLLSAAVRRATTVASLREWARHLRQVNQITGPAAIVILLSGVYLAFRGNWWGSGWLEVSIGMFILTGALSGGVVEAAAKVLVDAADAAPDGAIDAALDAQRRDRRGAIGEGLLIGTTLAIVFLMINKPGIAGALVVSAVGLGVGAALAVRSRRQDRAALTAAEPA